MSKRRNNPNRSRMSAAGLLTCIFCTWTDSLANTALARWKKAFSTGQPRKLSGFAGTCRKPFKRLIGPSPSPHRAKASVLIGTCGSASGTFGLAAALLLAAVDGTQAATHDVDVNSTNATPPYANWATAATNIQDAVDAAVAGDEVVVTNGLYASGGRAAGTNILANRVAVDKPLALRSVNGPEFTVVQGHQVPGTTNGDGAVRCVYLTNGASLSGFTLTNGATLAVYDYPLLRETSGGGVWCESTNAGVVSNCVLAGNSAYNYGGGVYQGTLNNCRLTGNSTGGSPLGVGGGGAYQCTLNNCALTGNSAYGLSDARGGGAFGCTLNNCALTGNWASAFENGGVFGGGAFICTLNNCTLTGNWSAEYGAGAFGGTLNNCISFGNYSHGVCQGCDSPGRLIGNNWFGHPLFVDTNGWANRRLQSNSPCINAGTNAFAPASPDLDGNPRIVGGTVDIGAYEYQSLSLINFGVISNKTGFNITGQSNQVIIVEASPDLMNWSPLATNTLSGHPFSFTDPRPRFCPNASIAHKRSNKA